MSGLTNNDSQPGPGRRRAERRRETMAEIVAAAWDLCRDQGLNALTMRDLGARVGMRAQSLYGYFDAKHAIYDAMFADGNQAFLAAMQTTINGLPLDDRRLGIRQVMGAFLEFCTADPTRFELLFQRTIPGFEPSIDAYRIAEQVLGLVHQTLTDLGVTEPALIDVGTAMSVGLATQQISNEPGGHTWTDLADRAVDLLLAAVPVDQ